MIPEPLCEIWWNDHYRGYLARKWDALEGMWQVEIRELLDLPWGNAMRWYLASGKIDNPCPMMLIWPTATEVLV